LPTGTINYRFGCIGIKICRWFLRRFVKSKYKINVYQLTEKPLARLTIIIPANGINNSSVLLGTKTFSSRTHTKFKITDIVTGAKDTLINWFPAGTCAYQHNLYQNILFGASSTVLASNTLFQDATKGLYVTMDKTKLEPAVTL
jgi:hypothetical protein